MKSALRDDSARELSADEMLVIRGAQADAEAEVAFTPKLLETLDTAKLPEAFFVLGVSINERVDKESLKAAFDAGHQIALQSGTHVG